jgi:hypothetical protein
MAVPHDAILWQSLGPMAERSATSPRRRSSNLQQRPHRGVPQKIQCTVQEAPIRWSKNMISYRSIIVNHLI